MSLFFQSVTFLKYGLHLYLQTIAHHKARALVTICTSYTNNQKINNNLDLNFEFVIIINSLKK